MDSEKIMIVDGNSILNRAFYGLGKSTMLTTSEGLYTNAVYGFINILSKFIAEEEPQYLCVAFDLKAPTFRHIEYDKYKAQRKGMPSELAVQVPLVKQVLETMNIKIVEIEGFEADDILGSISLAAENKGIQAILLTGDRDSLQLASKTTRIKLPVTKSNKTETEEYDYDKVVEKYGVVPSQLIEVKGLMGDTSDNIPGVPGIGEKTALDLIQKFSGIDNLYDNIERVEKKGVKEKLIQNRDLAYLSRRLATIERNIESLPDLEAFIRKEFDREKLYSIFKRLEFISFIEKYGLSEKPVSEAYESMKTEHIDIDCESALESYITAIYESKKLALYCHIDHVNGEIDTLCLHTCQDKYAPAILAFSDQFKPINAIKLLTDIMENESIGKYGHDLKTFIKYLKSNGIELKGLSFDTLIGAYILEPTRSTYTISEIASDYLNRDIVPVEMLFDKHGHKLEQSDDLDIATVLAANTAIIYKLSEIIGDIIKQNGQDKLYYDIELPLVEVLADMEYWGFKVDIEGLKAFSKELDTKLHILENEIYMLAGEDFNINSPKQLGIILFEKLNLPVIKKTKTGYSTDAEVLEQLSYKHEIVERILEFRQMMKLKSTYADGLLGVINENTGKIYSSFNQTVTATGRISSTEPNLQNIPIKLEMGR